MRFNTKQLSLLHILELNAAQSVGALGRHIKSSEPMVRHYIRGFIEHKIITQRQPIIDMRGLGFTHHIVYISVHSQSQQHLDKIIEFLSTCPRVTWIFELASEFQLAFSISAEQVEHVVNTLDLLVAKFGRVVNDKTVVTQTGFRYVGRRYLAPKQNKENISINLGARNKIKNIDALDQQILAAMANTQDSSPSGVARELKQPIATINRRIKDLENRQIIVGYFHWIHSDKLGRTCYLLRIRTRGFPREVENHLRSFIASTPEVIYVVQCIGAWDYEIGVEVLQDANLIHITRAIHAHCGDRIYPVQAAPILRYHKFRSFPVAM